MVETKNYGGGWGSKYSFSSQRGKVIRIARRTAGATEGIKGYIFFDVVSIFPFCVKQTWPSREIIAAQRGKKWPTGSFGVSIATFYGNATYGK
jgi:hypothetical protein